MRIVRFQTKAALILISLSAVISVAQTPANDGGSAQKTQARGYWVDPYTGLMWAAKDNGKDVTWNKAMKYCRDLRLAGYSDWRLANMFELQPLYDKTVEAPGLAGPHDADATMWHIKGNLFLTGYLWSSSDILDDEGNQVDMHYTSTSMKAGPLKIRKVTQHPSMRCACEAPATRWADSDSRLTVQTGNEGK